MGKLDSTKTRVSPLMRYLGNDITKLNQLLKLFNHKVEIKDKQIKIFYGKKSSGDVGEKSIPAPISLLEWYIKNPKELARNENIQNKQGSPSKETIDNREAFFNKDPEKMKFAKAAIKKLKEKKEYKYGHQWYIFEGYTNPDIYIETESAIFVGEAKRTEPELTGSVKWYEKRDQLIRHIDSVFDKGKKVYSFFILDNKNYKDLDKHGKDFDYYKQSLPHRSDDDIKKFMKTYIGCITWDEIAEEFPDLKKKFK